MTSGLRASARSPSRLLWNRPRRRWPWTRRSACSPGRTTGVPWPRTGSACGRWPCPTGPPGPRRRHGRADAIVQPALPVGPRRDLGPGPGGRGRGGSGRRGPWQGHRRPARSHRAPDAHPARRPRVRVLLRGPRATAGIAAAYVRGVQSAGVAGRSSTTCATSRRPSAGPTTCAWPGPRYASCTWCRRSVCPRRRRGLVMAGKRGERGHDDREHGAADRCAQGQWGFAGVVLSDWHAARSTEATALAGLDLAMPGPDGPWGERLAAAVRAGRVPEGLIDDKLTRLRHVAAQVGAREPSGLSSFYINNGVTGGLEGARGAGRTSRSGPAPAGRGGRVHPGAQRGRGAPAGADGPPRSPAAGPDRAERGAPGQPGRRQRRGAAGQPVHSWRRPAHGAGQYDRCDRAGRADGRARLCHLGGRAAAGTVRADRSGQRRGRRPGWSSGAGGDLLAAEHRSATMFTWWEGLPDGVGWGGDRIRCGPGSGPPRTART